MSLKDTLVAWNEAVVALDNGNSQRSLDMLLSIGEPSSKILYNIASIEYSRRGDSLWSALKHLSSALEKDEHFTIAYFQRGLIYAATNQEQKSLIDFDKSFQTLRGKDCIDYKQLGLNLKLYSFEVLYNKAVILSRLGNVSKAKELFKVVCDSKLNENKQIKEASVNNNVSGRLYELEPCLVFRPPKSKTDNLEKKNYLGKSKILQSPETNGELKSSPVLKHNPPRPSTPPTRSPKIQRPHIHGVTTQFSAGSKPLSSKEKVTNNSPRNISPLSITSSISPDMLKPKPKPKPESPNMVLKTELNSHFRDKLKVFDSESHIGSTRCVPKPPKTQPPRLITKDNITVKYHCNDIKQCLLSKEASLYAVKQQVCDLFDYKEEAFSIWYKDPNAHADTIMVMIENEQHMKCVWRTLPRDSYQTLNLWVFGKPED